ncbi:MAG: hypothetical protein J0H68_04215 [Sphingobacteriia bacterium]|nr:hypothetical protein [Sphingobacteriia bacterium]
MARNPANLQTLYYNSINSLFNKVTNYNLIKSTIKFVFYKPMEFYNKLSKTRSSNQIEDTLGFAKNFLFSGLELGLNLILPGHIEFIFAKKSYANAFTGMVAHSFNRESITVSKSIIQGSISGLLLPKLFSFVKNALPRVFGNTGASVLAFIICNVTNMIMNKYEDTAYDVVSEKVSNVCGKLTKRLDYDKTISPVSTSESTIRVGRI